MNFTIDRAFWSRGDGEEGEPSNAMLSHYTGGLCCLGHFARACGVQDRYLMDLSTPRSVSRELEDKRQPVPKSFRWLLARGSNSEKAAQLMAINDRPDFSDSEREIQIAEIFASQGHTVTFIGEGNPLERWRAEQEEQEK